MDKNQSWGYGSKITESLEKGVKPNVVKTRTGVGEEVSVLGEGCISIIWLQ